MMPRVRRAKCWRGRCDGDMCCIRMPLLALAVLLFFVCIITLLPFALFAAIVVVLQEPYLQFDSRCLRISSTGALVGFALVFFCVIAGRHHPLCLHSVASSAACKHNCKN